MKSIVIKDVPESMHIKIKEISKRHSMSMKAIILKMIQRMILDSEGNQEGWLSTPIVSDRPHKEEEPEEEEQDWGEQPVLSPEEKIAAITQAGYRREASEKIGKKYIPSDQEIEAGYYEQFGEQRP